MTEDEVVGQHHRLNGHGFWWTPRVGDGQGGLACCGLWGRKESDMTERLNCTEENESNRDRGRVRNRTHITKIKNYSTEIKIIILLLQIQKLL